MPTVKGNIFTAPVHFWSALPKTCTVSFGEYGRNDIGIVSDGFLINVIVRGSSAMTLVFPNQLCPVVIMS